MITHARLVNYAACFSSLTLTNPSFSRCEYDGGVILMLTLRVRIPPSYVGARSLRSLHPRPPSLRSDGRRPAGGSNITTAIRCREISECGDYGNLQIRCIFVRCYSPNSPCRAYPNSPVPRVRRITDCTYRFQLPRGNSITFHMPHSANAYVSTFCCTIAI